jgi:WD40 repeat protein
VSGADDQTMRIWDTGGWQKPNRGHDDMIGFAAFSDDGQRIRSGSHDGTVRVWDAATGRPIGAPLRVPDPVRFLDPIGEDRLLSLGETQLRLWDARTGKPIGEPLPVPSGPMGAVVWTVKPARIATQTEPGAIEIRDADTTGRVGVPIWPQKPLESFDLSPDGRVIATTSTDSMVRLWDIETGKPVGEPLKGNGLIIRLTFSPDGHLLAAAGQGGLEKTKNTVRVWDIRTRQPVGEPITVDSAVSVVAFSRDGRTLAAGSGDGTIRLWDVSNNTPLGIPLAGHTSTVTSLDFSPDGTKLLSASADHTLRIWPVPNASPDALCAKLTQNMSRHQWNDWVSPKIGYIAVCPGLPIADDAGPH